MRIALVSPDQMDMAAVGLADVLMDSVAGGASVGFLDPLSRLVAERWWTETLSAPGNRTWVARDEDDSIIGCVLLSLAPLENADHRAEVRKLLVHRRARGQGVGRALLAKVELDASALGRTLLLLDTESGSPAEALYLASGWLPYGLVPDHARVPSGEMAETTFMLKNLAV